MIQNLYTVYDKLAEDAGSLFEAKNNAVALRLVKEMVLSKGVHPDEYKLLHVGYFNTETAEITPTNILEEIPIIQKNLKIIEESENGQEIAK